MRRTAWGILLALGLGACQLVAVESFDVRLPSPGEGVSALDVAVVDHARVVAGVEGVVPADSSEGIARGGRPGRVIVSWLGGACDERTTLSVTSDAGTVTIRETTETTGTGCLLAGIGRSVALDLNRDIAPETFRLVREGGT